ncbi:hypothetical protein B0H11DRAFT_1916793 [Mycena galericulata]|nr:hypothetical protein B0H11DRAFT_1916793 [Mycena galericulata]
MHLRLAASASSALLALFSARAGRSLRGNVPRAKYRGPDDFLHALLPIPSLRRLFLPCEDPSRRLAKLRSIETPNNVTSLNVQFRDFDHESLRELCGFFPHLTNLFIIVTIPPVIEYDFEEWHFDQNPSWEVLFSPLLVSGETHIHSLSEDLPFPLGIQKLAIHWELEDDKALIEERVPDFHALTDSLVSKYPSIKAIWVDGPPGCLCYWRDGEVKLQCLEDDSKDRYWVLAMSSTSSGTRSKARIIHSMFLEFRLGLFEMREQIFLKFDSLQRQASKRLRVRDSDPPRPYTMESVQSKRARIDKRLSNDPVEAHGAGPLSRPSSTFEGLRRAERRRLQMMVNPAIAATSTTPPMLNPTMAPTGNDFRDDTIAASVLYGCSTHLLGCGPGVTENLRGHWARPTTTSSIVEDPGGYDPPVAARQAHQQTALEKQISTHLSGNGGKLPVKLKLGGNELRTCVLMATAPRVSGGKEVFTLLERLNRRGAPGGGSVGSVASWINIGPGASG